jgi:type II secretory ATPase GspE/PulE/Tfp pilus assembly ATPase PilB-like protein
MTKHNLDTSENKDNNGIDLDTLLTFLTDNDIKPEELKKMDTEKKQIQNTQQTNNSQIIFDININSIDDIIDILRESQYDFAMIEPNSEYVKISFKKDQVVKETKNIKFHIYSNILLQAKKISKLNLEDNINEQK